MGNHRRSGGWSFFIALCPQSELETAHTRLHLRRFYLSSDHHPYQGVVGAAAPRINCQIGTEKCRGNHVCLRYDDYNGRRAIRRPLCHANLECLCGRVARKNGQILGATCHANRTEPHPTDVHRIGAVGGRSQRTLREFKGERDGCG